MRRRTVLLGTGAAAGAVLLPGFGKSVADDAVAVRIWPTESAARFDGLAARVGEHVRTALTSVGLSVDLSIADVTPHLPAGNDRHVRRVGWPMAVESGTTGRAEIDPVADVNLLLTDGDPTGDTAGYATGSAASVAGATALSNVPTAADAGAVVDYSVPTVLLQLVLHECGHCLGLTHDHGRVSVSEGVATVSPMVNGYAWASESVRTRHLDTDANACGEAVPPARSATRRLSLRYSSCATAALGGGRVRSRAPPDGR